MKAAEKKKRPSSSKKVTVCTSPATGEKLAEFKIDSIQDAKNAIINARKAQPAWGAMPLKKRVKHIKKIRDYIVANMDELAEIVSKDNGKTRIDAIGPEILSAAMATSFYCKQAARYLGDRKLPTGNIMFINKRSRLVRVPYGVIGIISPWNYPFAIPFVEVIMALLAGNAVILKAAAETQVVGHALKKCIEAGDLPEHIFNYLNMPGSMAGDAFLDEGVNKLFFTGSVPVGKYLMKKASETLTPVSLELGGNDPMIVCEDADLERAAAGTIWAGFQNAGQSCGGIERIYVQKKVYEAFLQILKKKIEGLKIGPDTDFSSDIGAITTSRQMETVNSHIREAVRKGATIYARKDPEKNAKGNFLPCIVLTGVDHTMQVMKDETFGPVVGVMPYDTIEEAVSMANDSYLGLTASVWSRNWGKGMKIARMLKAGAVTINDHLVSHGLAETPWGGFKQSSIGRTHGDVGFDEMTQPQVIVNDILPLVKKNFWWQPFNKNIYEGVKGVAYTLYGKGILLRIKGAFALLKVFPRTFSSKG